VHRVNFAEISTFDFKSQALAEVSEIVLLKAPYYSFWVTALGKDYF
jgi:hypothetical protein